MWHFWLKFVTGTGISPIPLALPCEEHSIIHANISLSLYIKMERLQAFVTA
jgi:hypothetical protein